MKKNEKYLIVIGGPTAVGKTELSLLIATSYNCPILSADSRQFYREMSIGTAKPSKEEMGLIPHYFIDNLSIHDDYSVGQYEREAIELLTKIYKNHDTAVLVGGTGLYIKAILEGLDSFPSVDPEIKKQLSQGFKSDGIKYLQSLINEHDPEFAKTADIDNPRRLMRALSVILSSGQKFSSFQTSKKPSRQFIPIKISLTEERHNLYDKINERTDRMMDKGLLEEAQSLYPHRDLNALNTVGYTEIFEHLDGKCFLSEAVEKIKQNTRRYAKRQSTWFRNQGQWDYFNSSHIENIQNHITSEMDKN